MQRTRLVVLRRIVAVQVGETAPWVAMSPVEILGLRAIVGNPASREIRDPLVVAGTVAAAVMPNAAVAAEAAGIAAVAGIAAAAKRGDEEFQ